MANLPADVVNQALDAAGIDLIIGDIEEGTREAKVCLRAYNECVRQLQRGAHWDFARQQAPMNLLADATGQTANVGTVVPQPFIYEYSYPVDCLKVRYVPWNNCESGEGIPGTGLPPLSLTNYTTPNTPLTTGGQGVSPQAFIRMVPAPFLVTVDHNYPADTNQADSQWWEIPYSSPSGRTVILTNVKNAFCVYTMYMPYINMWDSLFRAAVVSYIASEVALPLARDKKFGLQVRSQLVAAVKAKLEQARITNGNEGKVSTDHLPDWIRNRGRGGGWGNEGENLGGGWGGYGGGGFGGWDSVGFSDGSSF
jgi:hypothetical protein